MKRPAARQSTNIVVIGIAILLVGGVFGYVVRLSTAPVREVAVEVPVPQITTGPATLQYPLTIPAQRNRKYPGGALAVEQDYGVANGYRTTRVSYPSDGYKVYALMAVPDSTQPPTGYPAIIVAHGYTSPTTYKTEGPELADEMRAFATHGYVVVKPDYRGYGLSWGAAHGAYFSPDYNADVLNLAASLARSKAVNGSLMGIFGYSMGGNVALDSLTIMPHRFKAAVINSAGIGTIDDMTTTWKAPSDSNSTVAMGERQRLLDLFGTPQANPAFWSTVSPLTYSADIATPILVQHGTADTVVPPRFSDQLTAELTTHGKTVQTYTYQGAGHVFGPVNRTLAIQRALDWYAKYLQP